jgi:hypothetical protein
MLIPPIDLMGGKIVQLVQGDKKALEFDNFDYWIERFSKYPLVQVIDLDAARGSGSNRLLVNQIVKRLNCTRAFGSGRAQSHSRFRVVAERQDQHAIRCYAGKCARQRSARLCPRLARWPGCDRRLAQRDCRYRIGHDSGTGTLLRHFPLHAHRYRRLDGWNPDADCECNQTGHFAAASCRWWHQDAARNRPARSNADGRRCRDGLVFRQDLGVGQLKPTRNGFRENLTGLVTTSRHVGSNRNCSGLGKVAKKVHKEAGSLGAAPLTVSILRRAPFRHRSTPRHLPFLTVQR